MVTMAEKARKSTKSTLKYIKVIQRSRGSAGTEQKRAADVEPCSEAARPVGSAACSVC